MNEKFFDLKKEKQDRMINAALKVFAQSGYQHASTDDIVKEASISKGLLFHYFGSKLGLYSFLFDYCTRFVMLEMHALIKDSDTDYFYIQRMRQQAQLQYSKVYPYMELFLYKCMEENVTEALIAIEEHQQELHTYIHNLDVQADLSVLGTSEEGDMIVNMMKSTFLCNLRNAFLEHRYQAEMLYNENMQYIELVEKKLK